MNDNEQNLDGEFQPQENHNDANFAAESSKEDIFSPESSRDIFSHSKDEEIAKETIPADEEPQSPETYEVYQGNPFDSFPKREIPDISEPKAEKPAFNPYEAPKHQQYQTPYQQNFVGGSGTGNQNYNYQQSYNYNQQSSYRGPEITPPKKSKGKTAVIAIIAVCIVIALGFGVKSLLGGGNRVNTQTTTNTTQSQGEDITINAMQTTAPSQNISNVNSVYVADKVRPSVVGVMTYVNGQLSGEGSGVLWGEDSTGTYTYVVTCAHVIDDSGVTFGVLLLDGKTYEAELVATDTRTDIGVLKIKATGLPLAEIGDSSTLKVGEPIYAIGNPGGSEYFGSITDGIISAIDRSVSATYTMTCIQHNAAINPGNSGGALVNTAGQIVGINSSKIASTEYEGMGFAVPTSVAQSVVESLIKYKYVPNRPKLGIQYSEVSAYQLYSMVVSIKGLPQGSLVIAGISSDSSLADTEAQVGDLIIAVNGKDMDDSSVLLDLIDTGAVGDTLTLTLCRIEQRTYKTETFDVTIKLIEDKGDTQQEEPTTTAPSNNGGYYYGGAGSFEDFFNDYFGFGW